MMALISEPDLQEALAQTFPHAVQARSETRLAAASSCRSWPGTVVPPGVMAVLGRALCLAMAPRSAASSR